MRYTAPANPLAGTGLDQFPRHAGSPDAVGYPDISLDSPDRQFAALVQLMEDADAAHPAQFTGTPPWGEYIEPDEVISPAIELDAFMPPPDLDMHEDVQGDPLVRVRDPFPVEYPVVDWYNDPQYYGLGVNPGVPNWDQPVESGHTQIIKQNPAAEAGWDAWSGRTQIARVARRENDNPHYGEQVNRRHELAVEKLEQPYVLLTQQYRDLLLAELKRRGVHNVVIADVPSVPFTEQVVVTDPTVLVPEAPIGAEGVLPFGDFG